MCTHHSLTTQCRNRFSSAFELRPPALLDVLAGALDALELVDGLLRTPAGHHRFRKARFQAAVSENEA
jgi:hypothetical protein